MEQTCYKCGAPMKVSKAGKLYCSALCWKGGEDAPVKTSYQPRPAQPAASNVSSSVMDLIAKYAELNKRVSALETLNEGRALDLHRTLEDSPSVRKETVYCPNCGQNVPIAKWLPTRSLCEGCANEIDALAESL